MYIHLCRALRQKLIGTGKATLVWKNSYGDRTWGESGKRTSLIPREKFFSIKYRGAKQTAVQMIRVAEAGNSCLLSLSSLRLISALSFHYVLLSVGIPPYALSTIGGTGKNLLGGVLEKLREVRNVACLPA